MSWVKNIASSLLLSMTLLAICAIPSQGQAAVQPTSMDQIMKMTPEEFSRLGEGDAMRALNQLSAAGHVKKLNELFDSYASTRLGLQAKFQFTTRTAITADGLTAPGGQTLDFKTLKGFIASRTGEAVTVIGREKGFEIRCLGAKGETSLAAQGFKRMSFTADGAADLDGNIILPEQGMKAEVSLDEKGDTHLNGKGRFTPKGWKSFDFQGISAFVKGKGLVIEADSGGKNWARIDGQRFVPIDSAMAIYTDKASFEKDLTMNKALVTTSDGKTTVRISRQAIVGGLLGGEFKIGRSVQTIGSDGKPALSEEIVTFAPHGTMLPATREMTYDSFFSQLKEATGKDSSRTWLKKGRNNNPALVKGLQILLGIEEVDEKGTAYFGPETDAKVREFEKNHKLSVTGIVGPKVYAALEAEAGSYHSADIQYNDLGGKPITIADTGVLYGHYEGPQTPIKQRLSAKATTADTSILPLRKATAGEVGDREEIIDSLKGGYWHAGVRTKKYLTFARNHCYDGAVNFAEAFGFHRPPSPPRVRAAGAPQTGRFAEGTFTQIPLSKARPGDPIYLAPPADGSHWGAGGITHITMYAEATDDPNDPLIAHSFSGKARLERLSEFRRAFRGGGQGWDRSEAYAYTRTK